MLTLTSSWGTKTSYSETSCDFFFSFFFQSDRPTQYQEVEVHSTPNEKKNEDGQIHIGSVLQHQFIRKQRHI